MVILWPLWFVFVILANLLAPLLYYFKRYEVRVFMIESVGESGELRQKRMRQKDINNPQSTSPLLS